MLEGKRFGFIGGGNMTEAIVKGLLAGGVPADTVMVAEPLPQRRDFLSSHHAVTLSDDNHQIARQADVIILAVKPQVAASVLTDLEATVSADKLVISIMAGISTTFIEDALANGVRVVRAMPNTPALIQAAATAISPGRKANAADLETADAIFSRIGTVVTLSEKQMDAVTGLSGSGPAYVYSFIEALSDAGVKNGLARDVARELAIQTVLGAARMVAETGEHPALLREKVTSPGGTTIAGLHALEQRGFHGIVMDAVDAACRRSKELASK
ncbi:pyrroline-5-carboxylate reductase [Geobacter sp. SVR]|uniref:pyrroline-5-carboxylate reductase n=1 Tax=Geobacter sp. SVR TaxID=2495594 RepID=UPI00143EFCC0|nr:pyrroline-5-carboxylate reductase [Geobacter sp. SVR]BCS55247.1 pyrroline-5-carboxylate reductase [Geobacter sp. SVR]GCF86046.1 pyrroline-5-carboxylate reductase [Geobacter sp. SVR]